MKRAKKYAIPKKIQAYFWDADVTQLDPARHANYVISRIFEYGDFAAIRWVLQHYPVRTVIKILRASKQISRRTRYFWVRYFEHNT